MSKIDTEGHDLHVLRGSVRLLARQSIGLIQFEYNDAWMIAGSMLAGARALLEGNGYEVYLLRRVGLFAMNFRRYGEYFSYSNFIAVSRQWASFMKPWVRGSI